MLSRQNKIVYHSSKIQNHFSIPLIPELYSILFLQTTDVCLMSKNTCSYICGHESANILRCKTNCLFFSCISVLNVKYVFLFSKYSDKMHHHCFCCLSIYTWLLLKVIPVQHIIYQ